jgi:predicted dehydrogenase
MKNWSIAIIGAGQLGSRHLQGLTKASIPMTITVFDTSMDALRIAEQRYNEVPSNPLINNISFTTHFEEIPGHIDLAIISTSSGPRFQVTSNLLENRIVTNILFEKFLFPKLSEYD